jgi:hypothetical protein
LTTFSPSTPAELVPAKKAEAKAGYLNAAQQGIEGDAPLVFMTKAKRDG